MSDRQQARDYANQQQFRAEIQQFTTNNHYTIAGQEARAYLVRLFEDNFPKLQREAMQVATTCAEEMAVAVLAEICEVDPSQVANLRKPNAQSALLAAQESYARTGDPDTGAGDVAMGRMLAKLVAKSVGEPIRSLNEIILDRAIRTVPLLTHRQINSLSVLAVLNSLNFNGDNPHILIESMHTFLSAYYGQIVTRDLEYSYMGSTGVGSMLFGTGIYEGVHSRHRPAMQKGFRLEDVPHEVEPEERNAFLEPDPRNAGLYRLRSDKVEDAFPKAFGSNADMMYLATAATDSNSLRKLRVFLQGQMYTASELKDLIETEAPELYAFLEQLQAAGAIHFHISALGYMVASQELSLRFPGSNLLGPLLALDTDETVDATEPHPSE